MKKITGSEAGTLSSAILGTHLSATDGILLTATTGTYLSAMSGILLAIYSNNVLERNRAYIHVLNEGSLAISSG